MQDSVQELAQTLDIFDTAGIGYMSNGRALNRSPYFQKKYGSGNAAMVMNASTLVPLNTCI